MRVSTRRFCFKICFRYYRNIDHIHIIKHNPVPVDTRQLWYNSNNARVSSHDQKEDLERQCGVLESYCAKCGWQFELIKDLGSGMNYNKKGLKQLLEMLFDGKINRLVITHKDRLLRFGAELIFNICEIKNVEVVIINQGDTPKSYEEELAADIIEIITVFSARLYGSRSHKNKKLLEQIRQAADYTEDTAT